MSTLIALWRLVFNSARLSVIKSVTEQTSHFSHTLLDSSGKATRVLQDEHGIHTLQYT